MEALTHHKTSAEISRYGVQQVSWKVIISALEKLGAHYKRNSGNHNEELYEFANGCMVRLPNPTRRERDVHSWVFKRLLAQIDAAGVPLAVFLGLLEQSKVSWYRPDRFIKHMAWVLAQESFDLSEASEQQRALKVAREHFETQASPEELSEAPAALPEETYSLLEAIDLALDDDPDEMRYTYYHRIKTPLYKRAGALYQQLKDELRYQEGTRLPRLSEAGVFAIVAAIEIQENERKPRVEEQEEVDMQEVPSEASTKSPAGSTKSREATEQPSAEPGASESSGLAQADESPVLERRIQQPSFQPQQERPTALTPAQALLALCQTHHVQPVFDGYTMVADETLVALGKRLQAQH